MRGLFPNQTLTWKIENKNTNSNIKYIDLMIKLIKSRPLVTHRNAQNESSSAVNKKMIAHH